MESKENAGYLDYNGMFCMQTDRRGQNQQVPRFDTPDKSNKLDMWRTSAARSRQISVGIVGAGFAGLRCADVLLQHGCKVTIFEARDRLGGRVAQSDHLGHRIDLGPNWIHGTKDNPIMQLAKATETRLHAWNERQAIVDCNGEALTNEEAGEYARLLWDDGLIADAFRYSSDHHDSIDARRSLYDFFVEKAEGLFTEDPADRATRKRRTLLEVSKMWGAYVGSPVDKQSLKYFWLEECIEGENPFVTETYDKILEAIARPAKEKAVIRLRTKVTGIISNDDTAVEPGLDRIRPSIETAGGDVEDFDEVVVTAPLGWLKCNRKVFRSAKPSTRAPKSTVMNGVTNSTRPTDNENLSVLPTRLSQAIENISYGTLDKVYVTFACAFWEPKGRSQESLSGCDDLGHRMRNGTSRRPSEEKYSNYPGFTHWLSPKYSSESNQQHWGQQGMNLAALPIGCAHPTLLFYIYGDCSKHIADMISSCRDGEEGDAKLIRFFKPYYSLLPGYIPDDPICTPKAVLATAWASDELAGYGSYSNFQIGLERGDEDIEVMRHGMPERGVFLAGEHTAPFAALGTTTGAYWSGEGVANRIIEAYGLQ